MTQVFDSAIPAMGMALVAGLAMVLGALLAAVEHIQPRWLEAEFRHGVMAFGGGALLSAVALVLVPEGMAETPAWLAAALLIGGGIGFLSLDRLWVKLDTAASQLAAMLSDFIPEAIALGAAVASGEPSALLLAGLIALQNLPEGFNAYREMKGRGHQSTQVLLWSYAAMAFLGPLAALAGYVWLADAPALVAGIMLFAAGGILYSVFQDIAPQVPLARHWSPPLGAVLGFVLGVLGSYWVA